MFELCIYSNQVTFHGLVLQCAVKFRWASPKLGDFQLRTICVTVYKATPVSHKQSSALRKEPKFTFVEPP